MARFFIDAFEELKFFTYLKKVSKLSRLTAKCRARAVLFSPALARRFNSPTCFGVRTALHFSITFFVFSCVGRERNFFCIETGVGELNSSSNTLIDIDIDIDID